MIPRLAFLFLLLIGGGSTTFEMAEQLYRSKKYPEALQAYKTLLDKHQEEMPQIRYNIAQCYMHLDSTEAAINFLLQVSGTNAEASLKSSSLNYLGFLYIKKEKKREALSFFQKALKENPNNEEARYNYELLKKQIGDEEEEKPEEETPPPPSNEDDNTANDWRKKFDYYLPPDNSEGLPTLHNYDSMPIDKALELLENMKQEEVKFLQQLRKSARNEATSHNQSEW